MKTLVVIAAHCDQQPSEADLQKLKDDENDSLEYADVTQEVREELEANQAINILRPDAKLETDDDTEDDDWEVKRFPLWYFLSPFYSNAHCAVRILLFAIENTLDLKIRTGADPHSVRTLY